MLYQVYYEQVFRFSYYFLKDRHACSEVVSEIFFSIWQSRKKLEAIANLEAYFYTVTKNEANRYLIRNSRHHTVSLDEIPIQLEDEESISPEDKLVNQEIE